MDKYKHLILPRPSKNQTLNMSLNFPYDLKYARLLYFTKLVWRNKLVIKMAKHVVNINNMFNSRIALRNSIDLSERGAVNNDGFESPYGYEDDFRELKVAVNYQREIQEGFKTPVCSKELYRHIVLTCSKLLKKPQVKDFFNFGISYAYTDSVLAKKFPSVNFSGIDRSDFTKLLNESNFSDISNLEFYTGDIFNHLQKHKSQNGVFFHTRTLTLLPKEFIEKLYKLVFQSGFQYIVCMEQIGMSRQTLKSYEFSDVDQPSVAYREQMYIHNYPYIFEKSGFTVIQSELLKTDHPHSDYRILSIVAKRK
jgi:hypothetical protein